MDNKIQENINIGMAITQSLHIATEVNKQNKKERIKYSNIINDAKAIYPMIIEMIKQKRKEEGL